MARSPFEPRRPVLISLRLDPQVPNLRRRKPYRAILGAIRAGNAVGRARVVEFSVLGNHLHLIVEANDGHDLARGVQGLAIRMARALNRVFARRGRVFGDRFHSRALATPTDVRNALAYVLGNARKHGFARTAPRTWLDPYSSAPWFEGWRRVRPRRVLGPAPAAPRTWLLRVGWRRGGLLDPAYVPG